MQNVPAIKNIYWIFAALAEPFLPIVWPLSHPICRLQGLFTAPVFPRRYCSVGAQMRHFAPAEVSSSPSADSLFKVQSAFLTKQKSRHIWKSCQLLCHGDPYPRLARYTSFHIYRLWAQSPVFRPFILLQKPKASRWSQAPNAELRRPVRWWKRTIFLFIQFSRCSYTNRITRQKVRVNRQNYAHSLLSKPKNTKFHYISLNVTKQTFRS